MTVSYFDLNHRKVDKYWHTVKRLSQIPPRHNQFQKLES